MARKKGDTKRPTRLTQQRRRQVESYEYRDKQRVNNPPPLLVDVILTTSEPSSHATCATPALSSVIVCCG